MFQIHDSQITILHASIFLFARQRKTPSVTIHKCSNVGPECLNFPLNIQIMTYKITMIFPLSMWNSSNGRNSEDFIQKSWGPATKIPYLHSSLLQVTSSIKISNIIYYLLFPLILLLFPAAPTNNLYHSYKMAHSLVSILNVQTISKPVSYTHLTLPTIYSV